MDNDLLQTAADHFRAGRLAEAQRDCEALLQRDATSSAAWQLYGNIAQRTGQLPAALAALDRALALRSDSPEIHFDRGNVLRASGNLPEAIESYRAALKLRPAYSDALVNLGVALANSGQRDEAGDAWQAALQLNPRDLETLTNLGNLARSRGQLSEAIDFAERALAIEPTFRAALNNLASAYQQQGRLEESTARYRTAIAQPGASIYTYSNLLLNLQYDGSIAPQEVLAEHLRWAERYEAPLRSAQRPHENDRSPDRRLRIGYVSPDFRDHSIAYFMEPILAGHRREQVEVFCYSAVQNPDSVTRRLQGYGHTWRTLAGVRDDRAAEMVRQDQIDILIDLAVHTSAHRLRLFAHKPAPVQATYLGYAGTTGLSAMDWRITDPIVDPPAAENSTEPGPTESLHTEKLMRLPRTQWCYRPPASAPEIGAAAAERNGFVTFGNATNLAKVTPQVIDLWARAVLATPGSRLAIKSRSFLDPATRGRITAAFGERGVAADRLTLSTGGNLAAYFHFLGEIDVCLDTFPFAGGTTSCHTLYMGVPVVTLVGATSVSRVGASVLTNIGLADLIAEAPEQFVRIAAGLASEPARLSAMRDGLRQRMLASPLCDGSAFVADLEDGYRRMWHAWCGR